MKRTDKRSIPYPKGISKQERLLFRKIILQVSLCVKKPVPNKSGFLMKLYPEPENLIIMCSGGLDSTVLAHAAHLADCLVDMPKVMLFQVNYNLRPNEVDLEKTHVENLCKQLGFEHHYIDVKFEDGSNLQARAREFRYTELRKLSQSIDDNNNSTFISSIAMTAHHKDDYVETRILSFLRNGTDTKIHNPLYNRNIMVYRPLLAFEKNELRQYAQAFGLSWCDDSSNQSSEKYSRNFLRRELLPLIKDHINPGIVKTLSDCY